MPSENLLLPPALTLWLELSLSFTYIIIVASLYISLLLLFSSSIIYSQSTSWNNYFKKKVLSWHSFAPKTSMAPVSLRVKAHKAGPMWYDSSPITSLGISSAWALLTSVGLTHQACFCCWAFELAVPSVWDHLPPCICTARSLSPSLGHCLKITFSILA